jgi:hypothetical protein
MTTTYPEGIQFMKIMLDWCSPQVARSMVDDMDFYIAETTDNESIRDSIRMVRKILYEMAEENLMIDEEEAHFSKVVDLMAQQKEKGKQ